MIQATELRIGNWLNGNHNGFSKDIQIYNFTQNKIQHTNSKQIPLDIKTFQPIPITVDWLNILGFTKDDDTDYRWYLLDESIAYDLNDNCIRVVDSWEFGKRKYVHEIQNLFFALTRKELELNGC